MLKDMQDRQCFFVIEVLRANDPLTTENPGSLLRRHKLTSNPDVPLVLMQPRIWNAADLGQDASIMLIMQRRFDARHTHRKQTATRLNHLRSCRPVNVG